MDNVFRSRRIARRIVLSWPAVALAGIITLLLAAATVRLYVRYRPLAEVRETLRADIAGAEERTAVLEERLERLQTPAGMEEEVRERFNVRRPNEEVLVIVREPGAAERPEEKRALSLTRMFAAIRSQLGL